MARDQLVPLGLITRPGKLGAYPNGALKVAENVVMRADGSMERVRDLFEESAAGNIALSTVEMVVPLPSPLFTYVAYSDTQPKVIWGPSTLDNFTDLTSSIAMPRLIGRAFYFQARERLFMNTQKGIAVHDYLSPSTANERKPRSAGLPPPGIQVAASAANPVFPGNTCAQWCCVIRRVFADGYTIQTPPSYGYFFDGGVAPANFLVTVLLPSSVAAGDIVEVYRTVTAPTGQDPGGQYYLALTTTLTSSNVSTGSVSVVDAVTDMNLGLDLYTNDGVEGPDMTEDAPPYAETMAVYKGYAFYGNLKYAPTIQLQIPFRVTVHGTSIPVAERATAIGKRTFACNITSGSVTIVGISAADMIGLKIGQHVLFVSGAGTPAANSYIVAVGASTITLNNVITGSSGAAVYQATDVMYISTGTNSPVAIDLDAVNALTFGLYSAADNVAVTSDIVRQFAIGGSTAVITISVAPYLYGVLNISVTNGQNLHDPVTVPIQYPPALSEMLVVQPKSLPAAFAWSKPQQPEACPPLQFDFCGSGTLYKMDATEEALWMWCSDGLWRLTGAGGQWNLDRVDASLLLQSPQASCVYRDAAWAYTNRGVVSVDSSSGINTDISDPLIGDILPSAALLSSTDTSVLIAPFEFYNEIWISINAPGTARTFYVFNVRTKAITTVLFPITGSPTPDSPFAINYDRQRSRLMFGMMKPATSNMGASTLRTDFPSTFSRPSRVEFQPLYSGEAGTTKQWIAGEYVFDAASNNLQIVPTFTAIDTPSQPLRTRGGGDSRVNAAVPRAAFVLNESLRVGFKITHTSQVTFYGVLPLYSPGSEQQLQK